MVPADMCVCVCVCVADETHLGPPSAHLARNTGRFKSQGVSTLAASHFAREHLMTTDTALYMLDNGVRVHNIKHVIQFEPCPFLTKTVNRLVEMRKEAKRNNDTVMDTTIKLVLNVSEFIF